PSLDFLSNTARARPRSSPTLSTITLSDLGFQPARSRNSRTLLWACELSNEMWSMGQLKGRWYRTTPNIRAPLNAVKARNKTIFPLVLYLPSIEPPLIKLDATSHRRPVSPEVPSTGAGFSSFVIPSPRIGPRCDTTSICRISKLDLFAVDSSA